MSAASLYHMVYQSSATMPLSPSELEGLLRQSRAWNSSHAITGLLLYCHGEIMQVLEGTEVEIKYIFSRISQDNRHFNLTKLADGPIARRHFSQWSMGFKTPEVPRFRQLASYQHPKTSAAFAEEDPDSLYSLLASFATEDEVRL